MQPRDSLMADYIFTTSIPANEYPFLQGYDPAPTVTQEPYVYTRAFLILF